MAVRKGHGLTQKRAVCTFSGEREKTQPRLVLPLQSIKWPNASMRTKQKKASCLAARLCKCSSGAVAEGFNLASNGPVVLIIAQYFPCPWKKLKVEATKWKKCGIGQRACKGYNTLCPCWTFREWRPLPTSGNTWTVPGWAQYTSSVTEE